MLVYEDMIDESTETFVYFDGLNKSIDELRELAKRFEHISICISVALRKQKTLDMGIVEDFFEKASDLRVTNVYELAHQMLYKKVD